MSATVSNVAMQPPATPEWLRLYRDEYWTLEELGEREGITREAIRQRLTKLGAKPRSNQETIQLRESRETTIRSAELRRKLLALRNYDDVAAELEMPVAWVKRFANREIPDASVLFRNPRVQAKKYSSEELLGSLKSAAAEVAENLSKDAYDAFQAEAPDLSGGRPAPGSQVMMIRFGSWRGALEAAGLPSNPRSGPAKTYDPEKALEAIVAAWRETGKPPKVAAYEAWAQQASGRPSSATVRKLMGSWDELLVRAWQPVHGQLLDQSDSDAELPPAVVETVSDSIAGALVAYRAAPEGTEFSLPSALLTETYEALERAVQAHARIQNAVAAAGLANGLQPFSPPPGGPLFDLALRGDEGRLWVVEVKSSTPQNRELQLRIALGQVLHYAYQLSEIHPSVVPVIAIEEEPGELWRSLLGSVGVRLVVEGNVHSDVDALPRI